MSKILDTSKTISLLSLESLQASRVIVPHTKRKNEPLSCHSERNAIIHQLFSQETWASAFTLEYLHREIKEVLRITILEFVLGALISILGVWVFVWTAKVVKSLGDCGPEPISAVEVLNHGLVGFVSSLFWPGGLLLNLYGKSIIPFFCILFFPCLVINIGWAYLRDRYISLFVSHSVYLRYLANIPYYMIQMGFLAFFSFLVSRKIKWNKLVLIFTIPSFLQALILFLYDFLVFGYFFSLGNSPNVLLGQLLLRGIIHPIFVEITFLVARLFCTEFKKTIQGWFNSIPIITRWLFVLTGAITLASAFGIVPAAYLLWIPSNVFTKFQIWRLFTSFFLHKLGFGFLIHMMFLYRFSTNLEQTVFLRRSADYLFMILFGCSIILIAGWLLTIPLLSMGMIMMIIYYWARNNAEQEVSFMFGFRFKAIYLPWVLIGFNFLMGGFPLADICGVCAGHLYMYLMDILPAMRGGASPILKTPHILRRLFPQDEVRGGQGGIYQDFRAPGVVQPPQQWGRGEQLGRGG